MHSIALNLVVLRAADLSRAADFYTRLGLQFTRHQHGAGPEHMAAELSGGGVFELYPLAPGAPLTQGTRIGFTVPSIDTAIQSLLTAFPDAIVSAPRDSEWGRRAVLADPDGHRVELLQKMG